jgi:hypothetical protein
MQKDLNIKKIQSKFQELINLDDQQKESLGRQHPSKGVSMISGATSQSSF